MKIYQSTVALVLLNLVGSQHATAISNDDGDLLRAANRELSLHSNSDQKLALFYGSETAGITTHAQADSFCREKNRVISSKKEWCSYAIQHSQDQYGRAPIRSTGNFIDVEEICGSICADDSDESAADFTVLQRPILCTKIVTETPTVPKTCASVYDDPHVTTFDGLSYDCHGPGDFILSKSLAPNGHELQGRFYERGGGGWAGSTTTRAVMKTGHPNEPTVEVGYVDPQAARWKEKMQYFIDGTEYNLDCNWSGEGTLATGSDKVQFFKNGDDRYFYFTESGISFHITKRYHPSFNHFINVRLCLPDDIKSQKVVGVFGSPNGNKKDDFTDRKGVDQKGVGNPQWYWGVINDYCGKTWCVEKESHSLFMDPGPNAFCEASIDASEALKESGTTPKPVANTPELAALCGDSVACITEGNLGGIEAAEQFLRDNADQNKDEEIPTEGEDDEKFDPDFDDLKEICSSKKTVPKTPKTTPRPTQAPTQCNIELSSGRGAWHAGMTVGFNEPTMDVNFAGTGLKVSDVNVRSGAFTITMSGQTMTLKKKNWVKLSSPGQISFSPKGGGGNQALASFTLPSCGGKAPTHSPTEPPTLAPTTTPVTPEPTPPPTEAPITSPPAPDSPSPDDRITTKAFTKGDPHFKTFGGELYDYHGECDLVLLHNPEFKAGLGMDIHIRTKIEAFWSSVESAVIKVGDDTMEIRADPESDEWLWFNGEPADAVAEGEWHRQRLAGFLVRYRASGPSSREAYLYLEGAKEVFMMKTFKSFLRVDVDWARSDNYHNSVGLLGSHAHEGKRLGRDGKFIEDANAFGQEWQVRPDVDGSLFHSYEGAIVGKQCVMPPRFEGDSLNASSLRGRRLGASTLDTVAAEKACNHLVDPEEIKACVFDVIATQDLSMASTW